MKSSKLKRVICLLFALMFLFGTAFTAFASETAEGKYIEELKGKKIGLLAGTMLDETATEYIENPEICYYNNNTDVALALEEEKIDAYLTDQPIARSFSAEYPNHVVTHQITVDDYGFIFKKDNDLATELCEQFNSFLAEIRENGLLDEIDARWFGDDESIKTIDFSEVENNSGKTVVLATCSSVGVPFAYIKDGLIVGYEIELAVEFCKAYGYNLQIDDYEFTGILSTVQAGMADIGAACITISEERKESMTFSDPTYSGGIVVVEKGDDSAETGIFTSISQLKGRKIGVLTGTVFDRIAEENIEDAELCYFNSASDIYAALDSGKIDAYIADIPVLSIIQQTYPQQVILKQTTEDEYAYIFKKDDAESTALCKQMNEFLAESEKNGLLEEIKGKWLGSGESAWTVDFEALEKNTGKTLRLAVSSSVGAPFDFIYNGELAGYDVDVAVEFCKAYGYKLKIEDCDFTGIMGAVQSGVADFGAASIAITEERQESLLFSDPNYIGGTAVIVRADNGLVSEDKSIFESIKESFVKTFVKEDRWKLFVSGIGNTMLITVASIVLGTLLGFAIYMLCRNGNRVANTITNAFVGLVKGMPDVVLLMILFYIVLGKTGLPGIAVAIIGFSLTFGASVYGMLQSGVGAIDKGQSEAAFALGFSSRKTFYRVILPQASSYILPGFRSEVVAHIKGTAIVGYIAVQDLTRISDIIRSRTCEAFFSLISTAVIYFLLEGLLIYIVKNVQIHTDKRRRTPEKILKGIKTK